MNENKDPVIMELQENDLTEMISVNVICRLCANQNDKLIGIYSEDGINNDLANKMNTYLPIKVTETDDLPLQCCWQCASTVLAWHDLVVTSVEADRRLRSYQFVTEKQLQEVQVNFQTEESCQSSEKQDELESNRADQNAFCQSTSEKTDKHLKEFVTSTSDNLSDFVIEQQYLQLNNALYGIKMEDKPLHNKELPRMYDTTVDDSLNDVSKDALEENPPLYNFTCQYCPMVFLIEEDIIGHITETHPDSEFKLDSSSEDTLQGVKKEKRKNSKIDQDLVNSAKVVIDGRTYYNCKECGKSLHSPYKYVWHMRVHTGGEIIEQQYLQLNSLYDIKTDDKPLADKELPRIHDTTADDSLNDVGKEDTPEENPPMYNFACQYCPMMFLKEEDIIGHITETHPDSEFKLESPNQDPLQILKKEKRKNNKIDQDLVNSAKVVVDGRIYYNCKECGKSLHSPYTYVWHMRIHTGERPYVCDLCGKQFRVSQGLVRHLRETHARIKNFACDLCGRMFATRRNVEEHRRIHTNERPYVCDLCGKSFKQKASLFVHNRSHTDSFPFKCTYCNQTFRTKPPLLIHVTKHTGEKPYPCDVCGRCFRIKYELKRHRLIHSDEKPFLCTTCGLSFRQKRYLRNHNKLNHTVQ